MKSFSGKLLFYTCILPVLTIMCGSTDADVQRKIDEVSTFIAREMESYYVPGASVAILNNYKPEWTQGYGVTDMTSKERVNSRTLFQAASVSQTVSAMATMEICTGRKIKTQ